MDHLGEAIELLRRLIATPSLSGHEEQTAALIEDWFIQRGVDVERVGNNVIAVHRSARPEAPYLLLNSHHDTVKPGDGWTQGPWEAVEREGKLFGLGSNDAGGALVTLIAAFMHMRQYADLPYSIMVAATAEEEISGQGGMARLTKDHFSRSEWGPIELAIVGEPTQMQMAVAEKGLVVLDCVSHGRTGHAARSEGDNAIYHAMKDIEWFRTFAFERHSDLLGPVHMSVTQIDAGSQHNVVPDRCSFVVDVRTTDAVSNEEAVAIIREHVSCEVVPRSMRLRPSSIPIDHPLVRIGKDLGLTAYGSPTMSDRALLPPGTPSLKIGPGDSARSHTPNEYIFLDEVRSGITIMIDMLKRFML
jgi:acetylornithine deacetylase